MARIINMGREGEITINGKKEKTADPSVLNGKQIAFSKAPYADWTFQLDGSLETRRADQEITELKNYLTRTWYPDRPVKIGDSWEFEPKWIKSIIEKDLQSAQTIGTMQLKQIRHAASGKTAIIAMRIESTGGDFRSDGTESSASIDLKGELTVDLTTMLDTKTTLTGSLRTYTGDLVNYVQTEVPINIIVEKFFTRD